MSTSKTNRELIHTIELMTGGGDALYELRVLGKPVRAGYFTSAEAGAKAAAQLDGRANIYVTLNPLLPPASAGKPQNQIARATSTTADADVAGRRWLLVDVDCKSKGRESATASELDETEVVARAVWNYLDERGWPQPLFAMSGNGYYLLYRIDRPNDQPALALISAVLRALHERFSTDAVSIDTSVSNASRIVGLIGTQKMKGQPSAERPHRRSQLLESEFADEVVTDEQMMALSGDTASGQRSTSTAMSAGHQQRSLSEILDLAGIPYLPGKESDGVTWYALDLVDGCPFGDSSGNRGKCGVGEDAEGRFYGKCFAAEHPWHDWRAVLKLDRFFSGKPSIQTRNRETNRQSAEAWQAIANTNDPLWLVRREGELTELIVETDDVIPRLVSRDSLRFRLDRLTTFRRSDDIVVPPDVVIRDMIVDPNPPVPRLKAIVRAPFFAHDGSLVSSPGYHPDTCLFLHLPSALHDLDTPTQRPTAKMARLALDLIDEAFCDFRFVHDDDYANVIAGVLTPFARTINDCLTPLTLVTSPTRGSGKGLLIDVISTIATGTPAPVQQLVGREEEVEKRLGAGLLAGNTFMHFDNIAGNLSSPALESFLTGKTYEFRVLGESRMVRLPQRVNAFASGNNVGVGSDMARRIMPIRIDPRVAHPEYRQDFEHPRLLKWVAEERDALVTAALVLIQRWIAEGMPSGGVELGSFSDWSHMMSGILKVIGIDGFLRNRDGFFSDADSDEADWLVFTERWWELLEGKAVRATDLVYAFDELPEAISAAVEFGTPRSAEIRLGRALMRRRDRVFGDLRLVFVGKASRSGSNLWRLEHVDTVATRRVAA